jgi:hypothetical protein
VSESHFESCWAEWACIDAMLWLSGEPLGPYWRDMGVEVREILHGLEVEGHKVWVIPCGLEVEGRKCEFYTTRIGGSCGPEKLRAWHLVTVLGVLGVGGVNNLWLIEFSD